MLIAQNKWKEVQVQTFGQAQPSCSRDQERAPISTEGLSKDSPVIISEEGAKAQEGLSNENEALAPLRDGSQIVIHAEVQATNWFETDFEATEVVNFIEEEEVEEGLPEANTEEQLAYSFKKGSVQKEYNLDTSEEEREKEYFSDHISSEDGSEIAGMVASPRFAIGFVQK
ncbi:hypothetical protein IFM89_036484 [Coptis chinensis]|uniref:Uncharacterized protein n=1 Tax=Coptis chinensis TaxID=261450 RepID=A0A835IVL5_9MAGN|nr:hypothetical protein IFM89_036484 [Coptis chinensis]